MGENVLVPVLLAGGTFNLAALASAVRGVGDGESVVIIADGDGQPDAMRHRIENDLGVLSPEAPGQTEILVFEPTFGEALGVVEDFAAGRRPSDLDRGLLRDKVRAANVRRIAENNREVRRLLSALGLDRKSQRHRTQNDVLT